MVLDVQHKTQMQPVEFLIHLKLMLLKIKNVLFCRKKGKESLRNFSLQRIIFCSCAFINGQVPS